MPEINAKVFGPQHWNAIAKDIRETLQSIEDALPDGEQGNKPMRIACMRSVTEVAIKLAQRFVIDHPYFDPYGWLFSCSPNPDLYPMEELWDDSTI